MLNIQKVLQLRMLNFTPMYYKVQLLAQPKMRRRSIEPIFPPPGLNLVIPEWTPEQFLMRVGSGASEYADKFENIKEIFEADKFKLKEKGVPACIRKHIFRIREELRRGVLTFEYLERRTCLVKPKVKK